jgi:hypothetical protein
MKITADQAEPGDVVYAPGDDVFQPGVYQAPYDKDLTWFSMQPTMGGYGPVPQPQGELILLMRNGVQVTGEEQ